MLSGAFALHAQKSSVKTGVDLKSMDMSVKPGDDFYRFANGTWLKENPVPAAESRWGCFNIVGERNNEVLRQILEEVSIQPDLPPHSAQYKVAAFYKVYMDTSKREQQRMNPIMPLMVEVERLGRKEDLMGLAATFHKKGIRCLFGFGVSQDIKNSSVYIPYLSQGGLGLPDRDFYFKKDGKSKQIREAYVTYISNLLDAAATPKVLADSFARIIMQIETALADSSMNRQDLRDPYKRYHKFHFNQFSRDKKNFAFPLYVHNTGITPFDSFVVAQPGFFIQLDKLIKKYSIEQWRMYFKWCLLNSSAAYLSSDFVKLHFGFYSTTLNGVKEQKPLWKRAIAASNGVVGELLAQLFVEKVFSTQAKQQVNQMVDNISMAFESRLPAISWMGGETKARANEKLMRITRKFGFPDEWKDYTGLDIKDDSYFDNNVRANEFEYRDRMSRMGQPVDKKEWNMLPQTVNAYYSAVNNEIVFPAAILQSPFFDPNADIAANYGAIGAVIGHEITHGFDDNGSKYDANGNLMNWWQEADVLGFSKLTGRLADQYSKYQVGDSLYVNGKLTLGENIADLGGLSIAYDAFMLYLQQHPEENVVKDGFTAEQRFFIGFAQIWKNNARPEALRQLVLTDPHSPGEYRVKGTLSNMPAFHKAFDVRPGQAMYRSKSEIIQIW